MFGEINRLLKDTQTLQFYEKELMGATGEHFNIFEILRIQSLEVTTHSPMLAELLNPQGRHGMGSRFLDIFAKQFSLELGSAVRVEQEYWAGPKSEDSGGRFDILISGNNDNEVVIENKIYATDQVNQISRYLNSRPQAKVLFLTLDGRKPIEGIPEKDRARFARISYKSDIVQWLEACRKEAVQAPLVRETLTQYVNLIKILTGQNSNSRMKDQIVKSILESKETLEAYFALVRSEDDVINELLKKLKAQCDEIGQEFGLQVEFSKPRETYGSFCFFDEEMKKQDRFITFQFSQNNFRSLVFGIAHRFEKKDYSRTSVADRFATIFGEPYFGSWWLAHRPWPKGGSWWDNGTFQGILSGEFKKELRDKVEKLVEILHSTNV